MTRFVLFAIVLSLLIPISTNALTEQEYLVRLTKVYKERDPSAKLLLIQELLKEADKEERFDLLTTAVKTAFEIQDYPLSERYANELLTLARNYTNHWNYGNAIHDGNMILGRLAVKNGNIKSGAEYLLKAGRTPGSPQLNSFGPNVSLAKDLLEYGEKEVVIEYFELCKRFWEMERGRLDSWVNSIRKGEELDYGANLNY